MMTRYVFEEIFIKGVRKFKDPVTGKPRQETRRFFQTINPFNKDKDGLPKTREQIVREITAQRDAWLAEGPKAAP